MKKLLLLFAAMLPCCLALSQEAEGNGKYADFHLIPRTEFNGFFAPGQTGDGSSGYNFGNTSFYTLVEGAFSDHVSFVLSNHWLAMSNFGLDETAALYNNTLYSNANNWLDLATVTFSFGNWEFTLGKDCLATGGFEYDEYDVDVDYMLVGEECKPLIASNLWYNLPCYQWGAKIGYNFGEHTNVALQMTTSPFGVRPFSSGLFTYSAQLKGNYGPFSNMWSATAIQRPDKGFDWLIALSQQIELEDFTIGLSWYNLSDVDYDDEDSPCGLLPGNTFRPTIAYAPEDYLEFKLIGNLYTMPELGLTDVNVGLTAHYYPWEILQVHSGAAWDMTTGMFSLMAGVKLDLTVLSL